MSQHPLKLLQVPARIANLSFRVLIPSDWRQIELPEEQPSFERPDYFFPLLVCMAGYGAVVLSVSARPAFEDGTVNQWVHFAAGPQKVDLQQTRAVRIGGLPAICAEATQETDIGLMRLRSIFLEDGGRLVNVSAMAPQAIWSSVESDFALMLESFQLDVSQGSKTPLGLDLEPQNEPTSANSELTIAARDNPTATAPAPKPTAEPQPAKYQGEPAKISTLALADDDASLNPEHDMNARLRNNGVGLVPRVLKVDRDEKFAVLAAGAIESLFNLPLGWHCIDDGRRTLVFDAEGAIQINLSLRSFDDRSIDGLLDAILAEYQEQQTGIEHVKIDAGEMKILCLRNLVINGEKLEQAFVVKQSHRPDMALVCRVTAKTEQIARALDLSEVIMTSIHRP